MSSLVYDPLAEQMVLWYTSRDMLGRFHRNCDCDVHGNGLFFTDKAGADWCIKCVEDRLDPPKDTP